MPKLILRLGTTFVGVLMLLLGIGVTAPAVANIRSGVVIKYSPRSDFVQMNVLLGGDYNHKVIYLERGQSYKVPAKYTKTLKVTLFGTGWRQRWDLDDKGYGGCHDIRSSYSYSSTFKPDHDIRKRVDFITYTGGDQFGQYATACAHPR